MSLVRSGRDPNESEYDEQGTLIHRTVSTALKPVRVLTSRPAIKAYLSTILFFTTSIVLLTLSSTAYAFFYYTYIPQINLEKPVYLQYGLGTHPHATAALETTALISNQAYDIQMVLHVPRTPSNLAAGNFMVDLALLGPGPPMPDLNIPKSLSSVIPNITTGHRLLHHSRRPAILPYTSPVVSLGHTFFNLPWHFLRLRDLDSSELAIPMFEMLSFSRGSRNIPTHIRLELQSTSTPLLSNTAGGLNPTAMSPIQIQVYSARVTFRARFQGLRYIIYNHRIIAFLTFSAVFYFTSLASMAVAWAMLSAVFFPSSPAQKSQKTIKSEPEDELYAGSGTKNKIKSEPESDSARLSNGHFPGDTVSGVGIDEIKFKNDPRFKDEDDDEDDEAGLSLSNLSDTPAQFPSGRGQMPLRYPSRLQQQQRQQQQIDAAIPTEEDPAMDTSVAIKTEEQADDEDDEEVLAAIERRRRRDIEEELAKRNSSGDRREEWLSSISRTYDSGIGTSMESEVPIPPGSGAGGAGVRRRNSGRQQQQQQK